MKRITIPLIAVLIIIALVIVFQSIKSNQQLPAPFETMILQESEDETHFIEKQKWIEEMHRSAPEDNWRLKDQMYRFQHQQSSRSNTELPVYGKWRELGSNNLAGRTVYTYLNSETETMYVASDGGQIWKGNIGAENWISINDHYKIKAIRFITEFETEEFTRLFVHSEGFSMIGIMYTDDDGLNWNLASGFDGVAGWGNIKRTVVSQDELNTIYCLSNEWDMINWKAIACLYKSVDMGVSFEKIYSFDDVADYTDIWTSQVNESNLYVVFKDMLYYLDEEDNLVEVSDLPNEETGKVFLTGHDTGDGCLLYAMINYSGASHFFASTLDGNTWEEKGTNSQGPFMSNSFLASPLQANLLYYGGMEAFYSYDAGANWTLVNGWGEYYASPEDKLHADIPAFNAFLNEDMQELLFISTDGGTYISYDQLENVENLSMQNLNISQYYSSYTCRFDPAFTHTGAQDQGYQRSVEGMNEGAINYDQIISGDYGNLVSGDEGESVWMVYPGFVMCGTNMNGDLSLILENFPGSGYQWMPKLMEDPNDPERIYMAGGHTSSGTHMFHLKRIPGHVEYTELPYDFTDGEDGSISAMAYSKIDTDYRYVLTAQRGFFHSNDGGNTWTKTEAFEAPASHYFYGASIAPGNKTLGLVYVAGSGYSSLGVYKSVDNGETFVDFAEGLPETLTFKIVLTEDDSLLFAATEVGAFVCKTWEGQWYSLADNVVPDQAFWDIDYVNTLDVMRFSTYGRGVWDFQLSPDVIAGFVASDTAIITGESVDFIDLSDYRPISWNWYFEGGEPETSTEQNPEGITYNEYGSFDVQLIVSNQNSTDTILKEDYINVGMVGIDNMQAADAIKVYPNPAWEYFTLETELEVNGIEIYTLNGRLCKSIMQPSTNNKRIEIDITGLETGNYMVKIITAQKVFSEKLIIQ